MPTKCTITGTVVAPDGLPVALAQIEFGSAKVRPMTPLTIAPEIATATTDEAGALTVELFPGEYSVRAMKTGRQRYPTFSITVPEAASAVLADIIDLPPPVSLDAAGQALAGARQARDEAVAAKVPDGAEILWPASLAIPPGWFDTGATIDLGGLPRKVLTNVSDTPAPEYLYADDGVTLITDDNLEPMELA